MNKKLAVAVMATGFVLPFAAHADVKVYGQAQAEITSFTNEFIDLDAASKAALTKRASVDATKAKGDEVAVGDYARGRFGVKADEDLGDGLKGIAMFEWKVDTTDNDSKADNVKSGADTVSLTARESFVGLEGGFGSIKIGRLKSPYKYMGGVLYDAFVASALEARNNGGMSGGKFGHSDFIADHIGWYSPKMSGVEVQLTYRIDDGGATAGEANELAGEYTFGVMYDSGPIQAFVAMANDGEPTVGTDAYAATKVGGQYKGGPLTVNLQYEMIDNAGTDETVLFLGGAYAFGKSAVHLQFGTSTRDDVGGSDDINYLMLALKHKFSKTTSSWIGYRATSDVDTAISVGLRKDFSS